MRSQACSLAVICLVAFPLAACGASPLPEAKNSGHGWRQTRDGYIHADTSNGFRSITRCWSLGDGLMDCVWIGGTANPPAGSDHFTAERWFASARPETAGPQVDGRQPDDAYYSCSIGFREGRLDKISENLNLGDGTGVLSNERWLHGRATEAAWAEEDVLAWSSRTHTKIASPLLDCERIGRMIESGSWAALTSNHWTGPNTTAADDLATLAS